MRPSWILQPLLQTCALLSVVSAFTLDPTSKASLIDGAQIVAKNLIQFYDGYRSGGTIGMFQSPIYWWESGACWDAYLGFWRYTGNTSYVDVTKTSLLWQVGSGNDYLPANFSTSEGNDDQAFWAMAAMSAAEYNFTNPTGNQPQWLALAQAVFNQQASRWDTANCNGGLRWQVFQFNTGYNYKNSISNAGLFNIAARLARYTGNQTYADWAEKVFSWQLSSGFTNASTYAVYDGATIPCTAINDLQWTYNNGLFLGGAAYMWNYTNGNTTWGDRVEKLMVRTKSDFFGGTESNIIYEPACEPYDTCNNDQHSFKAYLARNMAYTIQMYPRARAILLPLLASSARAAALACDGNYGGLNTQCGFKWTWNNGTFDGSTAVGYLVGQNLAALETIQANLIVYSTPPFTNATGGTSVGDVTAGNTQSSSNPAAAVVITPATTADKAGAAVLTIVASAGAFVFAWWIAL
ncbi:protein of unknown function [Taphrina deformans PYCC 5710]|uniref:Mannan endo-1,6-alpha-mannosidase n=1 Tax=Taphrina deformans (strain PYCC 5710 / ATCC 11124 / CBS 356.35 / IMI 108563 / JCM 9778 / NBRC 8474) TaxID=1097556 RepID=R4XF94_TAPDE|nr:protein of unknown function [Taphrina deformans PYCC 5710]|eukprot:CCG84333.1 protein of unknown function [Taphrina deformans PYCC 5710]